MIEKYLKAFREKLTDEFNSKNIYFELIDKNEIYSLRESLKVENIKKEVYEAKKTFQKYKWPVIDVTRKSVEETAASIIKIYEIEEQKINDH